MFQHLFKHSESAPIIQSTGYRLVGFSPRTCHGTPESLQGLRDAVGILALKPTINLVACWSCTFRAVGFHRAAQSLPHRQCFSSPKSSWVNQQQTSTISSMSGHPHRDWPSRSLSGSTSEWSFSISFPVENRRNDSAFIWLRLEGCLTSMWTITTELFSKKCSTQNSSPNRISPLLFTQIKACRPTMNPLEGDSNGQGWHAVGLLICLKFYLFWLTLTILVCMSRWHRKWKNLKSCPHLLQVKWMFRLNLWTSKVSHLTRFLD